MPSARPRRKCLCAGSAREVRGVRNPVVSAQFARAARKPVDRHVDPQEHAFRFDFGLGREGQFDYDRIISVVDGLLDSVTLTRLDFDTSRERHSFAVPCHLHALRIPWSERLAPAFQRDAVPDLHIQRLAFDSECGDLACAVDDGDFTPCRCANDS